MQLAGDARRRASARGQVSTASLQSIAERWYGCYGDRGDLFLRETYKHPAKMAVALCFRILEHGERRGWWTPGDTILDPMAGIGTTLICAASLGYHAIGIELEPHFYRLCRENLDHAMERIRHLPQPGTAEILQGDARQLKAMPSGTYQVASAVTSPPYGDQALTDTANISSDGYAATVTSPPYGGKDDHGDDPHPERMQGHGVLFRGYSGAVSSPPYGDASLPSSVPHSIRALARAGQWNQAIAASREYEREQLAKGWIRSVRSDDELRKRIEQALENDMGNYGARAPEGAQIGNLRDPDGDIETALRKDHEGKETYCRAMLRVYQQMHAVLRPGGVVALVTKNPVRDGRLRRLDLDTVRLMAAAGFEFIERCEAMLAEETELPDLFGPPQVKRKERKSFFKRLAERNGSPRVDHEDVLFFRSKAQGS